MLCARTTLGTINHTLLSIEAMRARDIPLLGIAFIGDENAETERIIADDGTRAAAGPSAASRTLTRASAARRLLPAHFDRRRFSEGRPRDDLDVRRSGIPSPSMRYSPRADADRRSRGRLAARPPTAGASSMRSRPGG